MSDNDKIGKPFFSDTGPPCSSAKKGDDERWNQPFPLTKLYVTSII